MKTKWMKFLAAAAIIVPAACSKSSDGGVTAPPTDTTTHPTPSATATVVAAGNIAKCSNGNSAMTAQIIDTMTTATVITLGNAANPAGLMSYYTACFDPTWGKFKARTYAAVGNHDYDSNATGSDYFAYFGDKAGPAGNGWYSFNVASWHIIVLNTERDGTSAVYASGSDQQKWLSADLAADTSKCTMAVWHRPRFLSSNTVGYTENTTLKSTWTLLNAAGVDIVLNGGSHFYERMAPMDQAGARDDAKGILQFNVGTGGENVSAPTEINPNSQVVGTDFGVLRLSLKPGGYDFRFLPVAGASFTDNGSGSCH